MKIKTLFYLSILFFLCMPEIAHAALALEYITWGGYEAIYAAFHKIALIFTDNGYKALMFSVITMGIFAAGAMAYFTLLKGGKGAVLGWAWSVGFGIVLYLGLILPTGTITVRDEVTMRTSDPQTLPAGVVLISGLMNMVERALVDIVIVSGVPTTANYKQSAGGMGFSVLGEATGELYVSDKNIENSFDKYNEDCVLFEMQRPGSPLTQSLINNNTDMSAVWALAASPAVYTVYYSAGFEGTGTTMTCQAAWTQIQADLSASPVLNNMQQQVCARAKFNTDVASSLTACKNLIGDFSTWTIDAASISSDTFQKQAFFARMFDKTLERVSPESAMNVIASKSTMSSGISSMIIANEWIPVFRSVMIAVIICLIPFLVMFIPTGLAGKAIGTMIGLFIWVTAWGLSDAIVHGLATDMAKNMFNPLRSTQLGYATMIMFPDYSEKALGLMGLFRTAGITLASMITAALIKFGGSAMTQMGKQLQPQAGVAADASHDLGKMAGIRESQRVGAASWANANRYDFDTDTAQRSMRKMGETGAGAEFMKHKGGMDAGATALATGGFGKIVTDTATGAAAAQNPKEAAYHAGTNALANINATREKIANMKATMEANQPGSTTGMSDSDILKKGAVSGTAVSPDGLSTLNYGGAASAVRQDANGNSWKSVISGGKVAGQEVSGPLGNAKFNAAGQLVSAKLDNVAIDQKGSKDVAERIGYIRAFSETLGKEYDSSRQNAMMKQIGATESHIKEYDKARALSFVNKLEEKGAITSEEAKTWREMATSTLGVSLSPPLKKVGEALTGVGAKVDGQWQLQGEKAGGEKVTLTLGKDKSQAVEDSSREATRDAFTQVASRMKSTTLTEGIKNSQGKKYDERASQLIQEEKKIGESEGRNMATYLVGARMQNYLDQGLGKEDAYYKAQKDINDADKDPTKRKNLDDMKESYVASSLMGYDLRNRGISEAASAKEKVANGKENVGADLTPKLGETRVSPSADNLGKVNVDGFNADVKAYNERQSSKSVDIGTYSPVPAFAPSVKTPDSPVSSVDPEVAKAFAGSAASPQPTAQAGVSGESNKFANDLFKPVPKAKSAPAVQWQPPPEPKSGGSSQGGSSNGPGPGSSLGPG
ncbi:MAG: hypothetical protein CSYNP_03993 [Syntrophus sp. SKADARSKE-3]|nr:hypothetical protein [Syntrophus sp. SKADARSKE-3]